MSKLNRFEWLKAVLQVGGLTSTTKLVASALSVQFANDETGQLNPGLATLMEFLNLPLSTLKRALKQLVNAGWLSRTEGRGAGNCTNYTLLAPQKIVPFRPAKKGSEAGLSDQEKGSLMVRKGLTGGPSYKEQSNKQKTRRAPPPDLPKDWQPGDPLRFIPCGGGYFEREWDDALQSYGLSTLHRSLPQIVHEGRNGYELPALCPAMRGSPQREQQIAVVAQLIETHRMAVDLAKAA